MNTTAGIWNRATSVVPSPRPSGNLSTGMRSKWFPMDWPWWMRLVFRSNIWIFQYYYRKRSEALVESRWYASGPGRTTDRPAQRGRQWILATKGGSSGKTLFATRANRIDPRPNDDPDVFI